MGNKKWLSHFDATALIFCDKGAKIEIPQEFAARFPDFLPGTGNMASSEDKGKRAEVLHC